MTPNPRRPTAQSRTGNFMWQSREGVISMYDMTPEHLRHAIAVCEQYNNTGKLRQLEEVLNAKIRNL